MPAAFPHRVLGYPHNPQHHSVTEDIAFPLLGPLGLFLLGSLVGLAASYNPALSIPFVLSLWGAAILSLFVVWWCTTYARVRAMAQVVAALAIIGAVLLFMQYRHFGFEVKSGLAARIGQFTSAPFGAFLPLSVQQNMAASFLEGALPLALGLWWSGHGPQRHTWLVGAGVLGAGILLTASRGALLALLVCAIIAVLARLAHQRPRLVGYAVIAAGMIAPIALALIVLTPLHQLPAVVSLMARATDRAILYRNSLFLVLDVPLTGIGPGDTFALMYSRYVLLINWEYLTYAHNVLLSIWLAQGLMGLVGFCGMLIAMARLMWRAGRSGAQALWLGAALGSLALLLHGLSDAPQYNPEGQWVMLMGWLIVSVAVASARQYLHTAGYSASNTSRPALKRAFTRIQRLSLAVVLAASLILAGGRHTAALAAVNIGAVAEARADLHPGLSDDQRATLAATATGWYRTALRLDPTHPGAARRLGIRATSELFLDDAMRLLEMALRGQPAHPATRKALGYAYLWDGRVQPAVALFSRLDRAAEVHRELETWSWFWRQQGRPDLARLAAEAHQHLQKVIY